MEALALERKAEQNRELRERLMQLKKERNAIILAHYYQRMKYKRSLISGGFLPARAEGSTNGCRGYRILRCAFYGRKR